MCDVIATEVNGLKRVCLVEILLACVGALDFLFLFFPPRAGKKAF